VNKQDSWAVKAFVKRERKGTRESAHAQIPHARLHYLEQTPCCNCTCNCTYILYMDIFGLQSELREQLRDADATILKLRIQNEAAEKVTYTCISMFVYVHNIPYACGGVPTILRLCTRNEAAEKVAYVCLCILVCVHKVAPMSLHTCASA
jgi:hypothetical protein